MCYNIAGNKHTCCFVNNLGGQVVTLIKCGKLMGSPLGNSLTILQIVLLLIYIPLTLHPLELYTVVQDGEAVQCVQQDFLHL